MTFLGHIIALNTCQSLEEVIKYLNENFIEIQHIYYEESYKNGLENSIEVTDVFFDLLEKKYLDKDCAYSLAFVELLADFFERYRCVAALYQIQNQIDKNSPLKNRIDAALLFHRINNVLTDYFKRFDSIINKLSLAQDDGEESYKSTITFINFYFTVISSFVRIKREDLIEQFIGRIIEIKDDHVFLKENIVEKLLQTPLVTFKGDDLSFFYASISDFIKSKLDKGGSVELLKPEQSFYTEKIEKLARKDFTSIRRLSINYLSEFSDSEKKELKDKLESGCKIIDEPDLLYSYMVAFGKMHYSKVYEALEKISDAITNKQVTVYDWGCGQALASMVFFEYITENEIKIDIKKLILIEPSDLAIERGIAHIKFISPEVSKYIKPICKNIDNIIDSDFQNDKSLKLHLFSNIIDVPKFNLDKLCTIISSLKGINIFICVSPMHSEVGRQIRLQKFYEYFSKKYKTTHLIAETYNTKKENKWMSNYCPCSNHKNEHYLCRDAWTRHEIVFSSTIS